MRFCFYNLRLLAKAPFWCFDIKNTLFYHIFFMNKYHDMNYTYVLKEFKHRAFVICQLPNCVSHIKI